MNKTGQAAMEFLMTYGWAILVVLVSIGALAFFGVLSTSDMLPEKCSFPAGMDCIGKASIDASSNRVLFVLQNNNGVTINLTSGYVNSDECTTPVVDFCAGISCSNFAANAQVSNNQKITVRINCTGGLTTGRFKSDVTIYYYDQSTALTLPVAGQIIGKSS